MSEYIDRVIAAQLDKMKTKEPLKSEMDHVKDLFDSYLQVKSIDARRMVIEEMIRLYKIEHDTYAIKSLEIFENVNMPKAVYDYLRPEIKLSWSKKVIGWFK